MKTAFSLAFVVIGALAFACSSDDSSTCTCKVTANGETKDLTCGQSACVGGTSFTCADGSSSPGGNACASGTSSSSGSSSSSTSSSSGSTSSSSTSSSSSSGSGDQTCTDLATFCSTKCKTPEGVNQSCTEAAGQGNGSKCVAWKASNASLCKP